MIPNTIGAPIATAWLWIATNTAGEEVARAVTLQEVCPWGNVDPHDWTHTITKKILVSLDAAYHTVPKDYEGVLIACPTLAHVTAKAHEGHKLCEVEEFMYMQTFENSAAELVFAQHLCASVGEAVVPFLKFARLCAARMEKTDHETLQQIAREVFSIPTAKREC